MISMILGSFDEAEKETPTYHRPKRRDIYRLSRKKRQTKKDGEVRQYLLPVGFEDKRERLVHSSG